MLFERPRWGQICVLPWEICGSIAGRFFDEYNPKQVVRRLFGKCVSLKAVGLQCVVGKETLMKKSSLVLFAWSVCIAFIRPVEAQETNNPPLWMPPIRLESFETNTGVVIIKGSTDIGSFSVNTTRVAVKAKEYVNVG